MIRIILITIFLLLNITLTIAQITVEAEDGAVTDATVSSAVAGFSGTGYVVFEGTGEVEVTVEMETAGSYNLVLGYRSAFSEKAQNLHVNGSLVGSIMFPMSETFTTLNYGQISLKAGSNTIAIVKDWGYMDLDYFTVQTESVPSTLPKADAGLEQIKMDEDGDGLETFTLDASGSTDGNDDIVSYTWYSEDGTAFGAGEQVNFEGAIGGYEFTLEVVDAEGNKDSDITKLFVGHPSNNDMNRIPLLNNNQYIFANGINLAWDDFARDVVELDAAYFEGVLDQIEAAGGNAMRWWLHTNGVSSPEFDDEGNVTGLDPNTIPNMRTVLDMAYNRGIMISMCLWSFDMLRSQGQDVEMMKSFVESKEKTQTYIDNALIPILEEIGTHPAVLTWEIFNEAEGMTTQFGWTDVKTDMQYVQQFVNLTAGAIHRTVPEALVSTGVWSFKALTDIEGNTNYYSDDRLIAAGGDEDGVLDFYQIHYYPEHFGNELSPFHRPADWWGLDKPILIGEFPTSAIDGRADPHYTTTEAYQLAYKLGYAGAMSWDFRGFDGGSFETAKEGITYLAETYPDEINIVVDPDLINNAPTTTGSIPDINFILGTAVDVENHASLDTVFIDEEDGSALNYSISENTNPDLATPEITSEGILNVLMEGDLAGTTQITVRAQDSEGASAWATFSISVQEVNGNLALFKPVVASSNENEGHAANAANDGDMETRWSSLYEDEQWIYIDLESPEEINLVKLYWEAAFGAQYEIQISEDAETWETVFSETGGDGGEDVISIDAVTTQYVRMYGIKRGTDFGFSLFEFEIYNEIVSGISDREDELLLFPNPIINNNLTLRVVDQSPITVEIFNLFGDKIIVYDFRGNNEYQISTSSLAFGVYWLNISTRKGTVTRKIMKQ